jgi:hypothetical protein
VWEDLGIARAVIDAGLWPQGLRSIVHGHSPVDRHRGRIFHSDTLVVPR